MTRYADSQSAFVEHLIQQRTAPPAIGQVVEVHTHSSSSDDSNHEVDVEIKNETAEDGTITSHTYRNVPLLQPFGDAAIVPDDGDPVLVVFAHWGQPVVVGTLNTTDDRATLATEGMVRFKRGPLYTEMHPSGDWARITKKSSDDGDPSARIEIDDSGSNTIVKMTRNDPADMGLRMNFGTGEFTLGDGSGYGIESDGSGNFTWYEQSVDFVDDGTTITW